MIGFQFANQRVGFLWDSVVLVGIGAVLIVLAPAKASARAVPYCNNLACMHRG